MDDILINVEFEKENAAESLTNEVHIVSSEISWEDFDLMLKISADCDTLSVLYWDDDDDLIPINSQDELSEAFKVARKSQNTLRMKVQCEEPPPMAELDSAGTQHGSDVDEKNDGQLYDMKRYFYLKNSETRDLVLDVEGMNRSPGAPVILWDQKFSTDHRPDTLLNQLWYEDTATSTIRTALNNFCLDRYGDRLVVNSFEPYKASQKFSVDGTLLRFHGGVPTDWQVVGLKLPIGPQESHLYLHVGPLDSLVGTQWMMEFVYIGIPAQERDAAEPFVPPWIQSCLHSLRTEIASDVSRLVSPFHQNDSGQQSDAIGPLDQVVHPLVACDVCDRPIIGVRYKCGFCRDYDLCATCEKRGADVHDPSHVLLKMSLPCNKAQLSRVCVEGVLRRCITESARFCDAHFIRDATYPDGSCVAPGATMTKTWIMRNTGSVPWTPTTTKVNHSHGSLLVEESEVSVPYTAEGDDCVVTVQLSSPHEPGRYVSHWRLYDVENKSLFGPAIWCSVIVVKSLSPEPVVTTGPSTIAPGNSGVDVGLSTEDLFVFVKTLEMTAAKKTCPLAVPTNTPLASTPPLYRADTGLSRVSSSGSVSSLADESVSRGTTLGLNMAVMADLVQEKMSDLANEKNGDVKNSVDGDVTDGGDDDDDDGFCVIPIPDCFNMDLPPSRTATTSLVVKKPATLSASANDADVKSSEQDSVLSEGEAHELVHTESKPELCETQSKQLASSSEVIVDSDSVYSVCCSDVTTDTADIVHVDHATLPVPDGRDETDAVTEECVITDNNRNDVRAELPSQGATSDVSDYVELPDAVCTNHELGEVGDEVADNDGVTEDDTAAAAAAQSESTQSDAAGNTSGPRSPGSLLGTAVDVAGKAASAAYSIAKDVYHTLQAQNAYVPPSSNWTPPTSNWTPPQSGWNPHNVIWTPPENEWTPPPPWSPPATDGDYVPLQTRTPMQQLIEMGFADRQRNQQLLEKYGADMVRVIGELVEDVNDWHNRH